MVEEYAYPYVEPIPGLLVIGLHALLLLVALLPFGGLFVQSRRPATVLDATLWGAALLVAPFPFVVGITALSEHSGPFLIGLLVLTEVVCLLALIVTCVRLYKQGRAISVTSVVGGLLALIVLVAMLLPMVPSAREAARRMQCTNNLRRVFAAVHEYHAEFEQLPAPITVVDRVGASWRIVLAPYFGERELAEQYDHSQVWDSANNEAVAREDPRTLTCPSELVRKDEHDRYFTAYALPIGPESPFSNSEARTLNDFPKGTSSIVAIVEACGRKIVWTKPEDVDVSTLPMGVNRPGRAKHMSHGLISSLHPGGANVVMLDGSLRFFSSEIDSTLLRQLLSTTEPVTAWDLE